ncbi:MAG: Rpn family recombination-promoting nuclease/putative transposase, partial [Magnetococcales bacterium]|nr:Rpn family recombination-promoting nuclease/putative transposase [Magnetococcales bacterium]
MQNQDSSYKKLYSHQKMMSNLLLGFVDAPWVQELDFATLQKVPTRFVSDDQHQREDDLVWRVTLKKTGIRLYLPFEPQSTPDAMMPVRAVSYTSLMWQDLKKSGQIRGRKLPPTAVVVLYTSKKRWRASLNIADMIQSVVGMERFLPHMEYLLVDINTISKKRLEALIAHGNLAALRIGMELCRSREELRVLIKRLNELLQPEQISLRRDFVMWLQRVL